MTRQHRSANTSIRALLPLFSASLAFLFIGCASKPDVVAGVEAAVNAALARYDFDAARKALDTAGRGLGPEAARAVDSLKARLRNKINNEQCKHVTNVLSKTVGDALAKRDFDAARDAIWTMAPDFEPEVAKVVEPFKARLLLETVNVAHYVYATNALDREVRAAIAKNDFGAARQSIRSVRPARVWTGEVEVALLGVREELIREKVPAAAAEKIVNEARDSLAKTFLDMTLRRDRTSAGDIHKPDPGAFQKSLEAFRDALKKQGCREERRDELFQSISDAAAPLFRQLWVPLEDVEDPNPRALGTSRLNQLLAEAQRFQLEKVVVPAQIAFRAKELQSRVQQLVDYGDLNAARSALYEYGVTGDAKVDNPVFAVKLGLLNARVNPATLAARSAELSKAVEEALASEDFTKASDAIAACKPVPSYSTHVDAALAKASDNAVGLGIPEDGAAHAISIAHDALYGIISPRPDAIRDARVTEVYARVLAGMEESPEELDWSAVRGALGDAAEWLVADDMSKGEADRLMNDVLAAFQALVKAPSKVEILTTAEVNRRLDSLKAELSAKVASAVAAKMAAEAAENAAKMHALALQMAARATAAVDFDARIAAFIEAVGDRVEPDVNRILGDGARVLRLRLAGAAITTNDSSSLLVAAVYMGFDDVMNLALTLGADIDAPSQKDELRRPALLLALQYGWRGHAADVLAKADRSLRDVRGQGVVHYAVRGGNGSSLMELLLANADTRTPDAAGVTPLALAADLGYAGLVQALIPFSSPSAADNEGFTALLRAAEDGRLDIVRILMASDDKLLEAKTIEGDGALELAALANAPDLLVYLLDDRRIAPTPRATTQMVVRGNVRTLQQLVAHGAALQDEHLATAVKRGDIPMVKYLVGKGMDVNAEVVKSQANALRAALRNGVCAIDPEIAMTILDYLHAQGQRP